MFIRFNGGGPEEILEQTVQCRNYDVRLSASCRHKVIRILDAESKLEFILREGEGQWNRAYLMNDDGHTIETILAPSLAAFQDARVREEGEAK